jgi:iron transport multicopper oxidase
VIVHATNGLGTGEGTALHTHGQFFNGTGWYDGAVQTTQCPIPPGETLDYHIDTSLQTGTYWYVSLDLLLPGLTLRIHGHHKGQYTDGLRARE